MLFTNKMIDNFFEVSTDSNGNHFLRKIIPMMPFSYNQMIIKTIFADFVELVNNKNSVCVLKVILKAISKEPHS